MANSLSEMRPSVLRPTSTIAKSFSMAMMIPLMTEPSWGDWVSKLCSSIAAKSSREGLAIESVWIFTTVAARAIQFSYYAFVPAEWKSADFPEILRPRGGLVFERSKRIARKPPGLLSPYGGPWARPIIWTEP